MPAPKFLAGLPKPVLFGLYGAIGGLVGALVFGEPLWHLLKPPAAPEPPPQVAVAVSPRVQVYRESSNKFAVRVARERFTGPVLIDFPKPPPGVVVPPVFVPAGATEAEALVTAAAAAEPGEYKLTATAEAEVGADAVRATAEFALTVVQPPAPPPAIAIAVPNDLVLYKRGTSKFTTSVARRNYDGPVAVAVEPLPVGVTATAKAIDSEKIEVTLAASGDAAVGTAKLNVVASVTEPPLKESAATTVSVQAPPVAPADIVFVLDVTKSMQWAIDDLKNGIGKFADTLAKNQLDFRLGLVTFQDLTNPDEKVQVVKFRTAKQDEESPFTSSAAVFRDRVGTITAEGGGDIPESSLEAVAEASNLPFRQGASKILLLITDAPPKVAGGNSVRQAVEQRAAVVKEKGVDSVHVVVTRFDLATYKPLLTAGADKVEGKYFNLGDVVRGDEGFDGLLDTFSRAVADAARAKTPEGKPRVADALPPPKLEAAAATTPKSADAPAVPSVQSVQASGKFAEGSEGRLTLATGVWTGAIAALVCLVLLAGQSHYLRGSLPAAGALAVGFLGGLAAGAVGGAAGQGLFMIASGSAALGTAFRVLGWALLGGLAGAGLALFVPNLKWVHGLAGGAIGGAVGAVGFLAVEAAAGDLLGRLVGGLLLGFGIGLMVAVVEAAFRRAWLDVRFGARETIRVNLGPEPVKIGGDAKACTVWARGAVPIALRFFVRDGQVICDEVAMRRESIVASGFSKEVGNVTVTVHTNSSTPAPATPPPRPAPAAPRRTTDDDFDLPMPIRPTTAPPKPPAPKPAVAPLSLDDDEPLPLPPPPAPPKPVAPPPPKPVAPAKPPVPVAPVISKPSVAPAPPKPPVPKPPAPVATAKPPVAPPPPPPAGAKHPDACPGCGRVNAGKPKQRYCMVCDATY